MRSKSSASTLIIPATAPPKSSLNVSEYFTEMTIEESQAEFFKIYKLLRVKKKEELGFSKKTRAELKKKFLKLSKVGVSADIKLAQPVLNT